MKRIVSLILCAVLVIGMLPSIAFAATEVASGTCGDNLTWVLDSDGLLTISGSGAMTDYESSSDVPWYSNRRSIKTVSLPQGLTTIGDFAFIDCIYLTDVTIPDSVTSIGEYTFFDCESLTSVTIPDSVTYIELNAFRDCNNLTGIWVDSDNPNYSNDSYGFLFDKGKTTLIQAPGGISGSYVIPNSVNRIGLFAFSECKNLANVTIPNSVTDIGWGAFWYCSSLTRVIIPASVTSIGGAVFMHCSSLAGIWVDENNMNYSSDGYGVLFNKDQTELVQAPPALAGTYTIPDSVISIGTYAFDSCLNMTGVTIPNSVTSIGQSVFRDCDGLTSVIIPASITKVGSCMFQFCDNLSSVTIPYGITCISRKAFQWCDNLTSITIPGSITLIDEEAFSDCTTLTEIIFEGIAPIINEDAFLDVTATAYHHGTNTTWTSDKLQDYGGTITWTSVDCTRRDYPAVSATCTESGLTAGNACSICGQVFSGRTTIPALGHDWNAATCTSPKTCKRCYTTSGSALGHDWLDATCTAPKTCSICGETSGSALGHSWSVATCTEPKTCTKCNITSGTALGHSWNAATCTSPKTCSRCSLTSGTALGHNYVDGICARCGEADSGYEPPKPTVDGVYRIAGADRIETSIGIANALKETLGVEKFSNIVVASALNFPDALAGSYLAALKDAPILLTYDKVHAQIAQYIADNLENHGTVYILGGEGAVSKKFEYELSARVVHFERVAGNDRFSTNMEILKKAEVPTGSTVLVCTALNFADSLSVSATGLPILLVHGSLRPDQMVFLNMVKPDTIHVVGGTGAVSDATMKEIKDLLPNATLERIWGENRHVTSATVATEFFPDAKSAVVAYSRNFPDGLCGGPLAYALGAPLLLTVSGDKTPNAYTDYYEINAGYVLGSGELVNDPSVRSIFHMSTADPIN